MVPWHHSISVCDPSLPPCRRCSQYGTVPFPSDILVCLLPLQEVCTLLLAARLMGDRMSSINWLGFAVCLSGISLHVGIKTYYSKGRWPPGV